MIFLWYHFSDKIQGFKKKIILIIGFCTLGFKEKINLYTIVHYSVHNGISLNLDEELGKYQVS